MSLSWKVFSSRATAWYCCALPPQLDLGPAPGRLGLDDEDPRAGGPLAQVGLGEVLTISRSSSARASGYQPASIRNRTTRSRSSPFFWSTRPTSDMITECGI